MSEAGDKFREMATVADEVEEGKLRLKQKEEEIKRLSAEKNEEVQASLFTNTHVLSEHEEITKLADHLNINATEARKQLNNFPNEYLVQDHTIPDIVRKMRKARRALKGEQRIKMSKAIDTMIDAYADHLQKCIGSITWLNDYTIPLSKMRYNEKDLVKLNKMKSSELRRETIDALCKYWEAELEQKDMAYGKEYSDLFKTMKSAKKEFRNAINKITNQSISKSKKQRQEEFILKTVCENPGISAKGIHERMPSQLFKISSPNNISKVIKKLDRGTV